MARCTDCAEKAAARRVRRSLLGLPPIRSARAAEARARPGKRKDRVALAKRTQEGTV